MIENSSPEPACRALELTSGRSVVCRSLDEHHDEVTISGPAGEVLLEIVLSPDGPRLRFHAAQLELDCKGSLEVRCERFQLETTGDIVQRAGREMRLEAQRGDVDVCANDDVNLKGERVRLNC